MPLASDSIDVVISNGAFCLAPDKRAAFAEVHRVLKPGGRFAICTSAMLRPLEAGTVWPLCMRMFSPMSELGPACRAAGLVDVEIDASDSAMAFEIPMDAEEEGEAHGEANDEAHGEASADELAPKRNRVHVGSADFSHLSQYDVNELCCRVVVTGRKPNATNGIDLGV